MAEQESYRKPLPKLTKANRPYWEYCRQHEFRLQRCTACGHVWYPPSSVCPACLSSAFEWAPMSGKGKIWSFIRMWQRYFAGFEADLPYIVGYVQLDEGPHMMCNIVGSEYDALACDLPVEVVFDDVTPEFTLPKFRLAGATDAT